MEWTNVTHVSFVSYIWQNFFHYAPKIVLAQGLGYKYLQESFLCQNWSCRWEAAQTVW